MIAPVEARQAALDLDPVGSEDPCFVGCVGGFERDRRALLAQPLQRRLGIVDQSDDDLAGFGELLDRDEVIGRMSSDRLA